MVKTHRGFSDSPKISKLAEPFELKINRLRHGVEDYYCAKFQVIPIRGFHFCHANKYTLTSTHPPIHIPYIYHDKVIAISALPCYVVGADSSH